MRTVAAIIPSAGVGSRFSGGGKKQFFLLNGRPILYYTIRALAGAYDFDEFIIGAAKEDHDTVREIAAQAGVTDCVLAEGGKTRADTVRNALVVCGSSYALIHDAVRPFITKNMVKDAVDTAFIYEGAVCGIFSRDTVKLVEDGFVSKTLDRSKVFLAHTPQVFKTQKVLEALRNFRDVTDEAAAYEKAGHKVKVCSSTPDNIKITVGCDIKIAEALTVEYFKD